MAGTCDSSTFAKRALLVGCNYKGTQAELHGCINDTELWHKLLLDCFGFPEENITVLTDEHASGPKRASKEVIKETLNSLVEKSKPGDILFFQFSGHGTQEPDQPGGDEEDGKDEILVTAGSNYPFAFLFDDELHEIFTKLPSGVKLTMISDCCHSGTILDKTETIVDGQDAVYSSTDAAKIKTRIMSCLECVKSLKSKSIEETRRGLSFYALKEFKKPDGLQYALKDLEKPDGSNVRSENFRFTSEVNTGNVQSNLNRGMVITGCRSTEGSAEIWIGSDLGLCGLLSFLATEQIRSCKDQENRILNNKELVLRVNYLAHNNGYSQHVRLEGLRDEADATFILW